MKECLDQVGLWECLGEVVLIALINGAVYHGQHDSLGRWSSAVYRIQLSEPAS